MIDYETYCKIRDHRDRQGLSITQTAMALGLHSQTVSKWSRRERYEQRAPAKRGSQLDPYKGLIIRWLEAHSLSAQQIFQRLREAGYPGGLTIVNTVKATFDLLAPSSDRRPALCPESRINPWALLLDPSRQSDRWDPENSAGYAAAATLTSLRDPSLESPQGSEMNLFALAASTIPRALLSGFDQARFERP